jgi:thiol-disulfide isomerase/thioredoxin
MAALAVALTACDGSSRGTPDEPSRAQVAASAAAQPASSATGGSGPRFARAPESGDLPGIVVGAMSAASAENRRVVVYVGATWCEPCQRFHRAVEQGELRDVEPLARVTLIEFDLDRDRERLAAAGYQSKYIPLFTLPGPDGRSSGKQVEGGIKGDGAVAYMVPRLTSLLAL